MPLDPSRAIRRRTYLIIGALIVVGVAAVLTKVIVESDYGVVDALLDLGYEALPAAILFVLINGAIGDYEQRQDTRLQAMRVLQGERVDSATALLNDLADGDVITVGNLAGTSLEHARLKRKTLRDGSLEYSDLDGLELSDCTVADVSFRHASCRLAVVENSTVRSAIFDDADLKGSLFAGCSFEAGTSFDGASLADVRFSRCTFATDVLRSIPAANARFLDCKGISDAHREVLASGGAVLEVTSPSD